MSVNNIDIPFESIQAVCEKLMEVLKMPAELLKMYTSKPYITEDEQAILIKAAEAYDSEKYEIAVTYYKKCSVSIGMKSNININNNNELSQLEIVIRYLLSKCLLKSKKFSDLIEAEKILRELEGIVVTCKSMIYCARGEFYVKLFCFNDAERMINTAFAILNKKNIDLIEWYVPITNEIITESTKEGLISQLLKLKSHCTNWHHPDAVCFMTNCSLNSQYHLAGRDIYFNSPAFRGMVTITCDNVCPCNIQFHAACWRVQKQMLSSKKKVPDKDFLYLKCFTSRCRGDSAPGKIQSIIFRDSNNTVEFPEKLMEKQKPEENKLLTGTRKKKVKLNESEQEMSLPKSLLKERTKLHETNENQKVDNEKLELQSRLSNLICHRENYFNIDRNNDWRPDLRYYGNLEFKINYDKTSLQPDCSNDHKEIASVKSFMYSYFYQFISKNGPTKISVLEEKWIEAMSLIGTCVTLLCRLNNANILEFLLQSLHFVAISDYICTAEKMRETFTLVKNNICTALRCLIESNNDTQLEFEDEKLEKSIIANANKYTFAAIDNSSHELLNNNLKDKLSLNDKHDLLTNDSEHLHSDSHIHVKEEKLPCAFSNTIQNNDEAMRNGDLTINNVHIDLNKNLIDMLYSLQEQLVELNKELKAKNTLINDMKMTMLRTNLDSQYMIKTEFINNRLNNYRNDHVILTKIQKSLMKIVGVQFPLQEQVWIHAIQELEKIKNILQQKYTEMLEYINNEENFKNIDNIHCNNIYLVIPKLPSLPGYNIPEFLQNSFDLCYNHFQKLFMSQSIISNAYLPPPFSPLLLPQYNRYYQPPAFCIPQTPPLVLINPLSDVPGYNTTPIPPPAFSAPSSIKDPSTCFSTMRTTTSPKLKTNDQEQNSITKQSDSVEKENVAFQINQTQIDDNNESVFNNSNAGDGLKKAQLLKKPPPSLDILVKTLRVRNPGVLEYELLLCVTQVRKKHNNSLTNLSISEIVNEAEQLLVNREKLQLSDYSTNLNKVTQQHTSSTKQQKPDHDTKIREYMSQTSLNDRQRKIFISSASSLNSISMEPAIKKNPWNKINSTQSNANYEQDECVICFETLNITNLKLLYRLQCKHIFHTKCIQNWFKENRSCPTCRVLATMDCEFPPLKNV